MSITRINPEYQAKGDYLAYTNRRKAATNMNDLTENGFYTVFNPTNAPVTNAWLAVLVLRFDNNAEYAVQVAFSTSSYNMHMRYRFSNTWSAWKKVTFA